MIDNYLLRIYRFMFADNKYKLTSLIVLSSTYFLLFPLDEEWVIFSQTTLLNFDIQTLTAFFSNNLVHADLDHWLHNTIFVLVLGPIIERRFKFWGALLIIMMGLSLNNLFTLVLATHPDSYAIGLSGITYAFMGAYLCKPKLNLLTFLIIPVFFIALISELITLTHATSFLGSAAHVGGFTGGLLAALSIYCWGYKPCVCGKENAKAA